MYERLESLAGDTEDWEIPIQPGVIWSLRNAAPHAILSANSGFGKSFFSFYLLIMAAIKNIVVFCADPKRADMASLSDFMPSGRVAWEPEHICEMIKYAVNIMGQRYDYMRAERLRRGLFMADYADFGLPPLLIFLEEMGAFVTALDRKSREAFEADLKNVTLKGRQAGVILCLILQNMGTQNISTESRSQAGFRVFLGNSGGIEYRMLFGEGFTYPKRVFLPGQGLYMLAGQTEQPEVIETPRLDKAQLPETLKRALEGQHNTNPLPPAPLEP